MSYAIRPEVDGLSSLAHAIEHLRDVADRTAEVYGVAVHTTGSGIVDKALKQGVDPFELAVAHYTDPSSYAAHYVVGYDGTVCQIADEHEKLQHIGFMPPVRQAYLTGAWENQVAPRFVELWKARWPQFKSPAHLFPGASPNNVYVGIEMLPLSQGVDAMPLYDGARYTEQQHDAVAQLCCDIAARWGLKLSEPGRLVTHEDISPLDRTTKNPPAGWDPGVVREQPWFNWEYLVNMIEALGGG